MKIDKRRLIVWVCLVLILAAGAYMGIVDARFLLQIFPLALLTGILIGLAIYPVRLKKLLIAAYSSSNRRAARPEEFDNLDSDGLGKLTREWETLGFVQRGDFMTGTTASGHFFRCLEHEEAGALAQITQQFIPSKTLPCFSSVTSLWGDESARLRVEQLQRNLEEAQPVIAPLASPVAAPSLAPIPEPIVGELPVWMLVTHNHAPNRFLPLLRQPRVMGARLPLDSSPAQVWHEHCERRTLVAAKLDEPLLHDDLLPLLSSAGDIVRMLLVKRIKAVPLWKLLPYRFVLDSKLPANYDGELAPLGK